MTINQKLAEFENALDENNKKYLLDKVTINEEVEDILNLKLSVIKVLPKDECYANAFILAEFALFLQKEYNRESAKFKWLEQNLNNVIAKEGSNYGDKFTKHEVRKSLIMANDEYAKVLGDNILKASTQLESLNFLATRVNTMAEILTDFARSKRN